MQETASAGAATLEGMAESRAWWLRISDAAVKTALRLRLVRAVLLYFERGGPQLADSITYRALFSVFAAVLLGFSVAGLWLAGSPEALNALVAAVDASVPGLLGTGDDALIDPRSIRLPVESLSITGVLSLAALVGAALGAIGALRSALRTLSGRLGDDTFWLWALLRNLALAVGIGVAFVLAAALTLVSTRAASVVAGWWGASPDDPAVAVVTRIVGIVIVYALDTALIAGIFVLLAGVKVPARSLWAGSLMGAAGLLVLQELSNLFVGGAASNPLLASFATLIALLLWLNLSAQVILIANTYMIIAAEDHAHPGAAPATSMEERRLRRAHWMVQTATEERDAARAALAKK